MIILLLLIYAFQGGPGFECALPTSGSSGWIKVAFENGYQVLLLDQRGTGLSSQISSESLSKSFQLDKEKADYLTHFRADSIIKEEEKCFCVTSPRFENGIIPPRKSGFIILL